MTAENKFHQIFHGTDTIRNSIVADWYLLPALSTDWKINFYQNTEYSIWYKWYNLSD